MLGDSDGGVPHGALLTAFAEAVVRGEETAALRAEVRTELGDAGLVDVAAVIATFNAIDRVADATGIPLDSSTAKATVEMRAELGIDSFAAG